MNINNAVGQHVRLLRRCEVERRIGLSKSSIYDLLNPKSPRYDATFPRPVLVGLRAKRFDEQEVDKWINRKLFDASQEGRV